MATKKKVSKKEERLTAYHEAGHAVAYHFFGQTLKSISIVADFGGGTYGRTLSAGNSFIPIDRFYSAPSAVAARLDFERTIIIALAGYVAETRSKYKSYSSMAALNLLGRGMGVKVYSNRDPTPDGDLARVRVLFNAFYFFQLQYSQINVPQAQEEHEAYFQWLWMRTVNIITEATCWEAVDSLASALLEHKKLTGQQAEEILAKHKLNNSIAAFHSTEKKSKAAPKKAKKRG